MKITAKLILSYLVIVALLIGLGVYAIIAIGQTNKNGETMYEERLLSMGDVANIGRLAENTRVNMVSSVLREDESFVDRAESNLEQIQEYIKHYDEQHMYPNERVVFEEFTENWNAFSDIVRSNIALVRSGNFEGASAGLAAGGVPFTAASENLESLMTVNLSVAEDIMSKNQKAYDNALIILIIFIVVAIILSIAIGVISGRNITMPIQKVVDKANRVANGDLTGEDIIVKNKDEIGELASTFNHMTVNLRKIVTTVQRASDDMAATSQELAASSEQVTAGIDEISTNTQQVAADAEEGNQSTLDATTVLLELSSLIQIAKQKANSATDSSRVTLSAANEGTATVNDTIARMESIKLKTQETEDMIATLDKYSKEIGVITDTITQLADQTNLLALNAAIEAARAGEAGKGFAVVADEVRKLAEQSNRGASQVAELVSKVSQSTKNAVEVTQQSRLEVDEGVISVTSAGKALENILSAVDQTVKEIKEIEEVTDSEVATSERIIEVINRLASVIENTAANAEEVAAATEQSSASMQTVAASAEQSSALALELKETVESFRV
nr:methyl-accepting chemotaxis protein [Bacillus sp. FJAT-45350]